MELEPALFSLQTSQVRPWEASQDSSRGPGRLGSAARTRPSLGSGSRSHTLRRSPPAGLPARPLLPNLFSPRIFVFCFFHGMSTGGLVDTAEVKGLPQGHRGVLPLRVGRVPCTQSPRVQRTRGSEGPHPW